MISKKMTTFWSSMSLMYIILLVSFHTGVINEYPLEYDALDLVVNNVYSLNNAQIVLQKFNVSAKKNLYKQGKKSHIIHQVFLFLY